MSRADEEGDRHLSIATTVDLVSRADLIQHCQGLMRDQFKFKVSPESVWIKPYMYHMDMKTGWDKTFIVNIDAHGVVGYINHYPSNLPSPILTNQTKEHYDRK